MIQIGFTTKYFTLWDVYEEPTYFCDSYGKHWKTGVNVHHNYIQNISFSREKVEKLYPGVEPDMNLRGTRSWMESMKYDELPVELYLFGKHYGERVEDVVKSDFQYVIWTAENAQYQKQRDYINSLPEVVEYFEQKRLEMESRVNSIPHLVEGMVVELEFRSNPNYTFGENNGELDSNMTTDEYSVYCGKNCTRAYIPGADWKVYCLNVIFNEVKSIGGMYPYTMAIINGKAQKIKEKTVPVKVLNVWINEEPSYITQTILVD